VKGGDIVKLTSVLFATALAAPALIVAVALGPVILGILCAVGCALLVMAVINFVIALGWAGRSAERSGARFVHNHHR
jgi:hypothetical protein